MIPRIEIDREGYPTEKSLADLEAWSGPVEEIEGVLDEIGRALSATGYGRAEREGKEWRFATGGWSGCEEIISAMPGIVWALAWESSHRGGLHVYKLRGKEG